MSDYREDVYIESFNEHMVSFDQYVQESALIIGGIIVGIVAFVTLIVLLIKKIFFSRNSTNGVGNYVLGILENIGFELDRTHSPKITVEKGLPIDAPSSDGVKKMLETCNTVLTDAISMGELHTVSDSKLEMMKNAFDGLFSMASDKFKREFVRRTYSTEELRDYIKKEIRGYKEAASLMKEVDSNIKKAKKDPRLSDNGKKLVTLTYKKTVEVMNLELDVYREWYKYIKRGAKAAKQGNNLDVLSREVEV